MQAVRNMFFPGHEPAVTLVPWCTFTDPELAHVGMTAAQAREHFVSLASRYTSSHSSAPIVRAPTPRRTARSCS